jgi:chromosome segregation ATPase
MSASTPPPAPPAAAPTNRGWDNILTIVIPVASVVAAVAMVIITYQVSRISDLGSDVKNVNNRVDQLFPLISQSTADIGIIKGSLVATAQQIATAAERNENISKRLEALAANQESQSKNIQQLTLSVSSLVSAIKGGEQQPLQGGAK